MYEKDFEDHHSHIILPRADVSKAFCVSNRFAGRTCDASVILITLLFQEEMKTSESEPQLLPLLGSNPLDKPKTEDILNTLKTIEFSYPANWNFECPLPTWSNFPGCLRTSPHRKAPFPLELELQQASAQVSMISEPRERPSQTAAVSTL